MTSWQSESCDLWKNLSKISRARGYAYPPSPYWCTKMRGERQVQDKDYSKTEFMALILKHLNLTNRNTDL